jgi:hypothetical protein
VVVTKPSGLVAGDLLIGGFVSTDGVDYNTPSGWTSLISSTADSTVVLRVFYKFADSADEAATNFTFTASGTTACGGGLIRVTGATEIDVSTSQAFANNSSTTKTATGVTPTLGSLLYIIFASASGNATNPAFSNYAMVTSNPSWSEAYDVNGNNIGTAAGYATRTQSTATGNYSVDVSNQNASTDSNTALVVVSDRVDQADAPTVITVNVSVTTPIQPVRVNVTINTPTDATTAPEWSNVTKNASTWVNTDKS